MSIDGYSQETADKPAMEPSVDPKHCIQVVYVSSATKSFSETNLLEIVQKAQAFNSSEGITGMLLYRDLNFMQVLEGPESAVRSLLAKIEHDPRHTGILVLLERTVDSPQFGDWSMGFRDLNTLTISQAEEYDAYFSKSMASEAFERPTAALKLLKYFKENMR